MLGWVTIQKIRKLEEMADQIGMKFASNKYDNTYGETIALVPKDKDSLPIYCRDAVLFVGSLEEAGKFMQGVVWARDYDQMLKISDVKKRERKEQDERNRQLVNILKNEKNSLVIT
jgi:hypothetical protein